MNGILLVYAASTAGYTGFVLSGKRAMRRFAFPMLAAGLALNIIAIVKRGLLSGHVPLASLHDVLLALAAGIVLISLGVEHRRRIGLAGMFSGIAALVLLGYASTLDSGIRPLVPALKSNLLVFHVGAYLIGYAGCALACAASVAWLGASRRSGREALAAELEKFMHACVLFAFPFLTAGMSLGMIWANNAWGRYWGWDPKESWSLITWLIYGYYVHMRLADNWGGRKTAYLAIAGFAAILFTLFGVNMFLEGLHGYR